METQLKKGLLDAYVLAILKNNDTYGYELFINVTKSISVSESTLYPILRRLEALACLTTYNVEHNGRLRKYYKITELGITRLEEYQVQCREMKEIINFILN